MLSMGVQTFRERWTLFVGTLLAVALGVGLTVSSVMLLRAVDQVAAATPEQREMAAASKAFVGLTLSLAIVLSTFIISSTLAFTVTERRRELALLRLSGASRRQVRLLLVGEAGVVGLLGAVIGVPLGLVLAGVHRWSLTRLGLRGEALSARVDTVAVLVGLGTGVGLALVAALVCSRRAVRARPLEALQDVGDAARVMTLGRWCWGMLFLGSTAAAVVGMQVSNDLMVAVGLGILVIFTGSVGLQQLSPLVVPLVGRVVGVVMRRHVEAELAQASLVDARRRTATTAGPVILLVGLVGGLFGVLATQTKATELDTDLSSRAQLVITSQGADLERIRSVPGVRVAAPVSEVRLPAQVRWQRRGQEGEATPGRPVVQVTDPAAYRQVATPRMSQGSLDSFTDGTVVVGENDDPRVSPRQRQVRVGSGASARTLRVVARTGPSFAAPYTVLVPRSAVPADLLRQAPTRTMVLVQPGASADQVRRRLAAGDVGEVSTLRESAEQQATEMDRENTSVMVGLAGLGGLYALLSVVNAVALGAAARRRELAVARIAGMSRAQVVRTCVLESAAVTGIGLVLGGVVTATCLYGVRRGMEAMLGQPVLAVPWGVLGLLAVVSLAAVSLTCAVATWMATRPQPVHLVAARE